MDKLTHMYPEWPKCNEVLAILSTTGLRRNDALATKATRPKISLHPLSLVSILREKHYAPNIRFHMKESYERYIFPC